MDLSENTKYYNARKVVPTGTTVASLLVGGDNCCLIDWETWKSHLLFNGQMPMAMEVMGSIVGKLCCCFAVDRRMCPSNCPLNQRFSTCGLQPLWESHIRYPAYPIFTIHSSSEITVTEYEQKYFCGWGSPPHEEL